MATVLWDDTYRGPRWCYGARSRPIDVFGLPPRARDSIILGTIYPHPFYPHGIADLAIELTPGEADRFDLTLIETVTDYPAVSS